MPHVVTRLCEVCLTHPQTSSSTSLPPCGQLLRLLPARSTHDPWLLFLICMISVPLSPAQRPCPPPELDHPSSVSLRYTSQVIFLSALHSWPHVNILSFPCSPEMESMGHPALHFQLLNCEQIHFCCSSHPVYGILLWQLDWANMLSLSSHWDIHSIKTGLDCQLRAVGPAPTMLHGTELVLMSVC